MALTEEEKTNILKEFDEIIAKAGELANEIGTLKRKFKKEEKDVEKG